MIKRIVKWMLSRLALRRLSYAMRTAAEWNMRAEQLSRKLERQEAKLTAIAERFERARISAVETMGEAEDLRRQSEHTIESLRNENGVLEKVLVPTLTAAHKLILGRIDAEVAIQVRRQVLAAPEEQRLD